MSNDQSQHAAATLHLRSRRTCIALAVLASSFGSLIATSALTAAAPASAAMALSSASAPSASVASATVQGPILPAGGISFLGSTLFPLSQVGYEESEYFLSGTATSYTSATPLAQDGKWHVTAATTAPYTTRVVVYRPIDPKTVSYTHLRAHET